MGKWAGFEKTGLTARNGGGNGAMRYARQMLLFRRRDAQDAEINVLILLCASAVN